jgi:hypothetical protein
MKPFLVGLLGFPYLRSGSSVIPVPVGIVIIIAIIAGAIWYRHWIDKD